MTRLRAALIALILVTAPAAAQVGYEPAKSPYRDLKWRQTLTVTGGGLSTEADEAGVGPQPGWLAGVRYDLRVGGPIALTVRSFVGPTWRRILDPSKSSANRLVTEQHTQMMVNDLGLTWNLTGQKSWNRLVPYVQGGMGMVTDFHGFPDVGGFRFGTRLMLSAGAGIWYHSPKSRWEPRADFSNFLWQVNYPAAYGNLGPDGSAAIVKNAKHSPWLGNHLWSLGMTYHLFR